MASERKAVFVKEYKSEDQALGPYVSRSHRDMLAPYGVLLSERSQQTPMTASSPCLNSWNLGGERRARCAECGYCSGGLPWSLPA